MPEKTIKMLELGHFHWAKITSRCLLANVATG